MGKSQGPRLDLNTTLTKRLYSRATVLRFLLFFRRRMRNVLLLSTFFLMLVQPALGQNEHFNWLGLDAMPMPEDSIEMVPYSGEANDFSGGYNVGDTVGDFHLWTLNGEEYLLSNEVSPDKPTIIFDGSASCIRFQNDWNLNLSGEIVDWVLGHINDFNWIPVYVAEAHAIDTENCPSNCPDLPIQGPNGQYLWQHQTVQDRVDAAQMVIDVMGPGTQNGWHFPFDDMLIDSPNNLIYSHFFLRPAGLAVINCDGVVVTRANWFGSFLGVQSNREMLEGMLDQPTAEDAQCLLVTESQFLCDENALDSDNDGTCDEAELLWGTDPFNPCDLTEEGADDTDGDGHCDALEVLSGTDISDPCDPLGVDSDGDGFCDLEEELMGSNPFNPCSPASSDLDGDGYCDSEEAIMGTDANDPCSPDGLDSDLDGLCNSQEIASGTDPNNTCDPYGTDSDGDGLCDQVEAVIGTSSSDPCEPYNQDTDEDGFCDIEEDLSGWDPLNACIPNGLDLDGDGWCTGLEEANGWNDLDPCMPITLDTDEDGWCDIEENLMGTDNLDPCSPDATDTDGDGFCDILEILNGTSPTEADATLGLNAIPESNVSIQVTQNGFALKGVDPLGQRFEIRDLTGRLLVQGQLNAFNTLSIPNGIYVLTVPRLDFQRKLMWMPS